MNKSFLLLLFLLLTSLMTARACAQKPGEDPSILDKLGADARIFLEDGGSYFTAPLRFSAYDWFLFGGLAAANTALITVDQEGRELLGTGTTRSLNDDFWDIPTRYGVVTYANILSLGIYTGGLLSGCDDVRTTGRLLFESISYSGISVMALRFAFGRARPYNGDSEWDFRWFEGSNEIQSFPSGHTTVAFALSTVLAEQFGGVWARIGFYGMASMTAYARVRNNQHWVSDVVSGGILGLLTGLYVVDRERERPSNETGLLVTPTPGGIRIVYRLP
jgi:membrane-associated phospholipid phosphatase